MTPSSCVLMAQYNGWMNQRLYDAAAQLPQAKVFEDQGAYFGSLFGTLNHICVGDLIWLHRFSQHPDLGWMTEAMTALPRPTSLRQRLAESLPELRRLRDEIDQVISAFADRISDSTLESSLHYVNTSGQPQARSFRALVQHFFNHQTHHRGQVTTLLFQSGIDVGVTDLAAIIPGEA